MIANDPLVANSVELMKRVVPPPATPDIWASVEPFWSVFELIEFEGMDVASAVEQSTADCQDVTDELWDTFNSIGE